MTILPTDVEPGDAGHADLHNQTNIEINAATFAEDPGTIVRRSGAGSAGFTGVWLTGPPTAPESATRKDYVDAIGVAHSPSGPSLIRRDGSGDSSLHTMGLETQAAGNHATRKDYVDPVTSISSTPARIGQLAVVAGVGYMATGTSSSADWKQITA